MKTNQASSRVNLPPDVRQMIAGLPQDIKDAIDDMPEELQEVAAQQPDYVNRRDGAVLVSRYVFDAAARSIGAWRLPWRRVGREAYTPPIVLLAVAFQKRATGAISMGGAAPVIRGRKAV
jgi:hypothetical protein